MTTLRDGAEGDVEACVALWLSAVAERDGIALSEAGALRIRGKFDAPRVAWIVAVDGDTTVGFALVAESGLGFDGDPADAAYLSLLAVAPEGQGAGLGRRLLTAAVDAARAEGRPGVVLHVLTANETAVRLYRATGWVEVGEVRPHPVSGRPMQTYLLPLA
ncbi:GNAT family N-acetyltransferase [Glaciibacter flavus]|uniref:GNAT family N-acetyltransferase n=1 Tax=Orlajensenia flava TaxID=2565934 RepID=UPI003AFFC09A